MKKKIRLSFKTTGARSHLQVFSLARFIVLEMQRRTAKNSRRVIIYWPGNRPDEDV